MKVTLIEGTPEELAEYERRTGLLGQVPNVATMPESGKESIPATLRSFIYDRAREPKLGAHVETYVHRVLDLGQTQVQTGTSKSRADGKADYLLVYDAGPRHYGAAAYVNAKTAGLTLRLTKKDVSDLTDPRIKFRNVQPRNGYEVNCPVTTSDAIDLAVTLTRRALEKVRRPRDEHSKLADRLAGDSPCQRPLLSTELIA